MIVIPMMGASSRFFDAGYDRPKFMLPLAGRLVFDWVLKSFSAYFSSELFVFVVRRDFDVKKFVQQRAESLGIARSAVLELEGSTRGQADTVAIALDCVSSSELDGLLTIFNADTFLPDFSLPTIDDGVGGVLDVFLGLGDHWSFVKAGTNSNVECTSEKVRISDLCSNGLYVFRDSHIFLSAFRDMVGDSATSFGEYYVAPVYNYVIDSGVRVEYRLVGDDDSIFCGTPAEYECLVASKWAGFV